MSQSGRTLSQASKMPSLLPGVESLNEQYVTNDSTGKAGGTTSGHRGIAPGLPGTARGGAAGGCVSAWPAEGGRCVPTADTPGTHLLPRHICKTGLLPTEAPERAHSRGSATGRHAAPRGPAGRARVWPNPQNCAAHKVKPTRRSLLVFPVASAVRTASLQARAALCPFPGARRPLTPPSPARPRAHPRPRPGT